MRSLLYIAVYCKFLNLFTYKHFVLSTLIFMATLAVLSKGILAGILYIYRSTRVYYNTFFYSYIF